jgi:hypothetical protein
MFFSIKSQSSFPVAQKYTNKTDQQRTLRESNVRAARKHKKIPYSSQRWACELTS